MSHHWKSPTVPGIRGGGMSPYSTPPQRNESPKSWSSPNQNWQSRNRSASQHNWSPQHYNPCSSPNGYWGPQRHWSPNRWEAAPNYYRSWSCTPKTLTYSPYYKQSPKHGSVYPGRTTQSNKQGMRRKALPAELRDRTVRRQRSGEGDKNISSVLKVPKSTVPSKTLTWKTSGTTRNLPRAVALPN